MPAGEPPFVARFEFATAARIVFGRGSRAELPTIAASFGQRGLLVTSGSGASRWPALIAEIRGALDSLEVFTVAEEPTVSLVESGVAAARDHRCNVVIALGGGSAIDAGKAIAALAVNSGSPLDYLEVVGRGQPLTRPSLPCTAVPTTAGTGAEVARNAVLAVTESRVKVSLRSPYLLPRVALIDPDLAIGLPTAQTAASGLDALTQLIEPFLCTRANPLIDALCRDGIPRAARALPVACREPQNADARTELALAALYSGIALTNAGLGAVHGFAGPIGGQFSAPHGAICAALLPHVLRTNLAALRARAPEGATLGRMAEIARLLTGHISARAEDAILWCEEIVQELRIPRLSAWGVTRAHFEEIARKASAASSMKSNPIALTPSELHDVLAAAI